MWRMRNKNTLDCVLNNSQAPKHSDSRQYIKADISNLPDSTEVPIVALYAFTGDEEVNN